MKLGKIKKSLLGRIYFGTYIRFWPSFLFHCILYLLVCFFLSVSGRNPTFLCRVHLPWIFPPILQNQSDAVDPLLTGYNLCSSMLNSNARMYDFPLLIPTAFLLPFPFLLVHCLLWAWLGVLCGKALRFRHKSLLLVRDPEIYPASPMINSYQDHSLFSVMCSRSLASALASKGRKVGNTLVIFCFYFVLGV